MLYTTSYHTGLPLHVYTLHPPPTTVCVFAWLVWRFVWFGHLWSFLRHLSILHVRASIWRNVSEHNEPAGQGTVSLQQLILTHQLLSSSQTTWKEVREKRERERERHKRDKRLRGSLGVRLGNTSAASVTTASLTASVAMATGTVRHPGGRDGPKICSCHLLQEREKWSQYVCVCVCARYLSAL